MKGRPGSQILLNGSMKGRPWLKVLLSGSMKGSPRSQVLLNGNMMGKVSEDHGGITSGFLCTIQYIKCTTTDCYEITMMTIYLSLSSSELETLKSEMN